VQVSLRGPRVTLRPIVESDATDMLRATQDPELRRLTGTHRVFTRADTAAWARSRAAAPGRYDWAIVDTATGGWLGDCSLNGIDTDNDIAGYRIALSCRRGQGLGTEATDLVLAFAFGQLRLYRVELEVFDFNVRAQKSYAKSGFTVEGIKRGGLRLPDGRHDVVMMAAANPAG
jgi:RimJ/RimL family protein N-acetyltransferase